MDDIVAIKLDDLKIGMVVVRFDKGGFVYPHYGKPFPDALLKQYLKHNGVSIVYVDKNSFSNKEPSKFEQYLEELAKASESAKGMPALRELRRFMKIHAGASNAVKCILNDVRLGRAVEAKSARGVINGLVDQCIRNPDAFISMTRLKDYDSYTFNHSVNVSVISIAIGRRLGLTSIEMSELGFAGMLHDLGKMMIPEKILNKPGKLDEDEYEIIKMHPCYGYDYLTKDTFLNKEIRLAVRHHHEKSDGSGYPDGIDERGISKYAKIVAIADIYDAITSKRVYHSGIMPTEALSTITNLAGKHFSETMVNFFINIIGIYPIGTLVVLDTNELGVILDINKKDPMRPKVLIISDSSMKQIPSVFFDLTSYNVVTGKPYKSIVSAVSPDDFAINTNQIIENYMSACKVI